jgi:DNA-binding winged helix-turn-helix (wHTH) protein/tetratricopeptide (TPR) repeat protein
MGNLYPKKEAIGNPYQILTGMDDQGKKAIAAAERLEFGPFQLQPDGRLYKRGNPVPLSPKEREVLRLLVSAEGRIVTKGEILQTVWGEADISETSLTRCIHFLRHHLGEDTSDRPYIRTVYGLGYCLELPIRRVAADVRLLILPFTAAPNHPAADYLCSTLTSKVSHYLRQFHTRGITLIACEASQPEAVPLPAYKNLAQSLGAGFVVEGQLQRDGERLTLHVTLHRTIDVHQLLNQTFTDPELELDTLAARVGAAIANQLPKRRVPLQNPRLVRAAQTVPQAYEAYLEAHYLFRRRNADRMKRAIELFQLAIQWDPDYAQAYVGLAGCYGQLMGWTAITTRQALPLVNQALDRAEAIDPTTPGLQVLRAAILSAAEWKFAIADQKFKAALSEETADVESLLYYARHLLVSGQIEAALEVLQTVSELDPLSPLSYGIYSFALHCARCTDEALNVIDRGLKLEPDAVILLFFQCLITAYTGRYTEALQAARTMLNLSSTLPGAISTYAYVCASAGLKQEALQYVEQASHQNPFPGKSLMAPTFIALGDHNSAIAWLEQALAEADIWLALVSIDPRLDPIRSHPRFQSIVHQMGQFSFDWQSA